ncbi:T9SS type A sorting domain-containing protein [Tenacibaculum sp. 190524A02b]|uniref:Secretion system C-terminal sorting domain-containing protein n=1 Tax=Tenacibaculum vairaonense TaxID=3137860 RepID=A0ABM9PS05_9FLAO
MNKKILFTLYSIGLLFFSTNLIAQMSPASFSTLTSNSATFTWDEVSGATLYELVAGSYLSDRRFASGQTDQLSHTFNNLPTNGVTLYVRLWYKKDGSWSNGGDFFYTCANLGGEEKAKITSPTVGSEITTSTPTFTWGGGTASEYDLKVGGTYNSSSYYVSGVITTTSHSITSSTIPTDGSSTIYVTLWSKTPTHGWIYDMYKYNDASLSIEEVNTFEKKPYAFPSPVSSNKGMTFRFGENSKRVDIYNVLGQKVKSILDGTKENNYTYFNIDEVSLVKGTYYAKSGKETVSFLVN